MKIVTDQSTTESLSGLVSDIHAHLQTGPLPSDQVRVLNSLVQHAVEYVEHRLRRALLTATFKAYLDGWPDTIEIDDKLPITAVSSVQYYDVGGDLQTLGSGQYTVDIASPNYPAVIKPVAGAVWPVLEIDRQNPIVITFTAGYGTAADIPAAIKHAIALLVADPFKERENTITGTIVAQVPFGVEAMLSTGDWGAYT